MPEGRIAVIVKLHHVMADGVSALALFASLASDHAPAPHQIAMPSWREIAYDNLRAKLGRLRRVNPMRFVTAFRGTHKMLSESWNAPRTSLNAPVGPKRSLAVLRLDLAGSVRAKGHQLNTAGHTVLVLLARLGLVKYFSRRQHMTNVIESNIAGPPESISVLGAPVFCEPRS